MIALMLWVARKRNPDLYVQITEKDIQAFEDCVQYLKVTPEVRIERPQGLPAQASIPASGSRRAVPGREATPPKPYVIVSLLGRDVKGITGPIQPIENNEADFDEQQKLTQVRRWKDRAPDLASRLVNAASRGEFSSNDMEDAAQALVALAGAV